MPASSATAGSPMEGRLLLTNVKPVSFGPNTPSSSIDILIDADGKIAEFGPSLNVQGDVRRVDGKGAWISPGWVDLHTHPMSNIAFGVSADQGSTWPLSSTRRTRHEYAPGVRTLVGTNEVLSKPVCKSTCAPRAVRTWTSYVAVPGTGDQLSTGAAGRGVAVAFGVASTDVLSKDTVDDHGSVAATPSIGRTRAKYVPSCRRLDTRCCRSVAVSAITPAAGAVR